MSTRILRIISTATAAAVALSLTACSSVGGWFDASTFPLAQPIAQQVAPSAAPELAFNSVFTDMGSIHPRIQIGDNLELELDMWTEQKTHEWYTDSAKNFSFVISVYDKRVPADSPFETKRRVYMSNISVSAVTSTTSGRTESPFVLNADPVAVTLDPEALRGPGGLLITSPKGGFQLESNKIGTLAADTYGITLDFAMTISTEVASGTESYATQIVHQPIPIAVFSRSAGAGAL